jgi:hypothetical protein
LTEPIDYPSWRGPGFEADNGSEVLIDDSQAELCRVRCYSSAFDPMINCRKRRVISSSTWSGHRFSRFGMPGF